MLDRRCRYRFADGRLRHDRHTAPFALLAGGVPDIVKRALVTKGFSGKCRSTREGPLHLVDGAVSDFRFGGLNGHQNCGSRLPELTRNGHCRRL